MIKGKINKYNTVFVVLLVFAKISNSQVSSPFNNHKLIDTSAVYSFIVSGHFHGSSTNKSTFPASSLLANIDTLNSLHPLFLMSLGDMFVDVNEQYIQHYKTSLFNKLNMPLFNAVGNHDVSNGNMYEKVFGKSFFYIKTGSEFFIVLNTEINDGSIEGDQLAFLSDALKSASSSKNIFIFSHRPVWSENYDRYKYLFADNTRTAIGKNNFESTIKPLLFESAKAKNIFWISGSLGGGPASFFYDKDPETNVHFMQTAIRDMPRDAALQVTVNNGIVSFNGISFSGEKLNSVESYNIDYWNKTIAPEKEFNLRLLPYLAKQMLLHYYFWIGFVSSLLLLFILRFLFVKWKRKG